MRVLVGRKTSLTGWKAAPGRTEKELRVVRRRCGGEWGPLKQIGERGSGRGSA